MNIGGDQSIGLMDFINSIENNLNKKANIKFLPKQLGDIESTESDCSKLYKNIGFKPKTNINDGIASFINWYKKYKK